MLMETVLENWWNVNETDSTFRADINVFENINALKTKINLIYIYRLSPYRAVNTLRFSYTNQSVNAVQ